MPRPVHSVAVHSLSEGSPKNAATLVRYACTSCGVTYATEAVAAVCESKHLRDAVKIAEATDHDPVNHDPVNHPSHYVVGGIETIDYIQSRLSAEEFQGYCLGNVLKYLSRAGRKGDKTEDLRKAKWYLSRAVDALKP